MCAESWMLTCAYGPCSQSMFCSFRILRMKKDGSCEPNTVHKVQGKPYFCSNCHCAIDIGCTEFEGFETFLYVFLSVL